VGRGRSVQSTCPPPSVIDSDPVAAIERLKNQPGKDIVQYGFGQRTHAMLEHGLLDEVRLWMHPLFVRSGSARDLLFREGTLTQLALDKVTQLDSGVVILAYHVR
jgi:dihydrofolate reductase